jgi:hypothetical protein
MLARTPDCAIAATEGAGSRGQELSQLGGDAFAGNRL